MNHGKLSKIAFLKMNSMQVQVQKKKKSSKYTMSTSQISQCKVDFFKCLTKTPNII